ncbi:MAG: RHS repeat-associated core domain-containing protein [Planctomycetota bacterium]
MRRSQSPAWQRLAPPAFLWALAGLGGVLVACRQESDSSEGPALEILSPSGDVLTHDVTPEIIVTYREPRNARGFDSFRCLVNGRDISHRFVKFETGAAGSLPPEEALDDGRHEIEVSMEDGEGHSGSAWTTFRLSAHAPQTVLKGRVVDSRKREAVQGLPVRLEGTDFSTLTDGNGQFVLRNVPAGHGVLRFASPAGPSEDRFPWTVQRVPVFVLGGAVNELANEITYVAASGAVVAWSVRREDVDPAGRLLFDLVLVSEESSTSLTLPVGTRLTFADGSHYGQTVALTQLRPSALPVPAGADVPFVYHIGPHGLVIDPPASISVANYAEDMLPSNSVDLLRFNEDAGIYETYATLTTGTDSMTGSGIIRDAGFYVPAPSPARGSVVPIADDANPIHDGPHRFGLRRGNVVWDWSFPSYQSLGQERSLALSYSSTRAWPSVVFHMDSTVPTQTPLPNLLEARLSMMGVPIGGARFFSTEGLSDFSEITSVQALRLNARSIPSGTYPFSFELVSHYGASAVSTSAAGRVTIEGGHESEWGPGWVVRGIGRLEEGPDGTVVLSDGRESPLAFSISPTDRLRFRLQHDVLDREIVPLRGTLDPASLYGYGTGTGENSSNTGFEKPNTSTVFLYIDTQRATLSLVMLNDSAGDGTGGRRGYSFFGLPTTAYLEVADDPADDFVVRSPNGCVLWEWTAESNDGGVISGLEKGFDLTLVPVETEGIAAFEFLQGDLEDPEVIGLAKRNGSLRLIAEPVPATELPDEIVYLSPPSEGSVLRKRADNTFVRDFPDGARGEYDDKGRLVLSVTCDGERTEYAYNASGHLVLRRDPAGLTTEFDLSGGFVSRITDPAGRTALLERDGSGRMTALIEPGGARWEFTYDKYSLLTSVTDPVGIVTTYEYSPVGVLRRAFTLEDPRRLEAGEEELLAATDLEGGPHSGFPREDLEWSGFKRTEPAETVYSSDVVWGVREGWDGVILHDEEGEELPKGGLLTTYMLDDVGHVASITDAGGLVTVMTYDEAGRLQTLTSPAGRYLELAYDDRSRLASVVRRQTVSDAATERVTGFSYDPVSGRLATVHRPEGEEVHFEYGPQGRLERLVDGEGNAVTFSYGNATFPTLPTTASRLAGSTPLQWDLDHDEIGNLVRLEDPSGDRSVVVRDRAGRISSVKDGAGRRRLLTYNKMNRVTSLSGAGISSMVFDYDLAGRLVRVSDGKSPAGVWDLEYDGLGRLKTVMDPSGLVDEYTYDVVGNTVRLDLRTGDAIAWDYDPSRRLIQKSLLPAIGAIELVTITPDADGRPAAMADDDSSVTTTYNGFSEVASVTNAGSTHLPAITLTLGYDRNGRLTTLGDGTSTRTFGYDRCDRLESFTDSESGLSAQLFWDEAGRLGLVSLSNGVELDYSSDAAGRLLSLENRTPLATVSRFEIVERAGSDDPLVITQDRTVLRSRDEITLHYDAGGRLAGRESSEQEDEEFSYDPAGYRSSRGAVVDPGGRLLSDDLYDYSYDASGRLVQRRSKAAPHPYDLFRYDVEGRLIAVTGFSSEGTQGPAYRLSYRYDPFGRLIERQVNGAISRYLIAAGRVQATYASSVEDPTSNLLSARFLDLEDGISPIAMRADTDGDGVADTTYTLLPDFRGNIGEVLDEALEVMQASFYSSYGDIESVRDGSGDELDRDSLPVGNPFGFAGGLYEALPRLVLLRDRVLDPLTGRFLTENPLGLAGGINPYAYARSNPYRFHDPLGLVVLSLNSGGSSVSSLRREIGWPAGVQRPTLLVQGVAVIDLLESLPPLLEFVTEAARFFAEWLPLGLDPGAAGGFEAAGGLSEPLEDFARGVGPADWARLGQVRGVVSPLGELRPAPWLLR